MNKHDVPGNEPDALLPADLPNVLTRIARLAEGVKSEFDLIAGRMSWLVIADLFLVWCGAIGFLAYSV